MQSSKSHDDVKRSVAAALPQLKRLVPKPGCFGAQSIRVNLPEHQLGGVLSCRGLVGEPDDFASYYRRPGSLIQRWVYTEPEGCNGVVVLKQVVASGAWDYSGLNDEYPDVWNMIHTRLDWEAILLTLGKPSSFQRELGQNRTKYVSFGVWLDKCGHRFIAQLDERFLRDPRVAQVPCSDIAPEDELSIH